MIDRSAIASVVLQGAALPAPTLAGPDYWGYRRTSSKAAYATFDTSPDIERAKQLLKEANVTGPITIGMQGSSAVHEQTANVIQAAGRKLGLDIQTKVIPVEQFGNLYSDAKAREGLDGFFTTWYGNFPDPLEAYSMFVDGGANNFGGYNAVSDQVNAAISTSIRRPRQAHHRHPGAGDQGRAVDPAGRPADDPGSELTTFPGPTASIAYLYYPWAATVGGKESEIERMRHPDLRAETPWWTGSGPARHLVPGLRDARIWRRAARCPSSWGRAVAAPTRSPP